ncbi:uncharacterized protein LOC143044775 [Mytilus galloprovincialis]|uniref:uncharacterized protein LOC143044775 n=1 Tax=Mytilus galloprovincialis TaxID=29158 RepID=UPI003F7B6197
MPSYCCVPGCKESGGHKFPSDKELNLKWRVAIRRTNETRGLWRPGKHDIVCHNHFTLSDYKNTLLGDKSRLKKDVVPSVFPFRQEAIVSPRALRMKSRDHGDLVSKDKSMEGIENGIQYEVEIETTSNERPIEVTDESDIGKVAEDKNVQCGLLGDYSIENFINNPKAVSYYTGFSCYDHFIFLFHSLGPAAYELNYKCVKLEPKDQLFLTLMKIRCGKEDFELSLFFNISESTVSRTINTWINFLYFQLKDLDIWPSRQVVDEFMPVDFGRKFPTTRVILDATEIPIQKPSDVNNQSVTWSSYKHRNTIKTMVGCTPRGAVSYVSDCYGGSVSDRQIIENSHLLENEIFDSGDSIMADRGIMVQDLFANQNVFVNTPTMLKGKSQLEPEEIIKDRRVASKRIHIERVIGLSKRFKILKYELSSSKFPLSNRIVFVCFALLNFKNAIVDKLA